MHSPLRVLVGSLAPGALPTTAGAGPPDGTLLLDFGPDHPSGTGLLELRLWTSEDVISTAEVVVGAMHRGAEKLFEVRDYWQIMMLANRHDWQAAFAGELGIALACERLLRLEVPARAGWLRTLLAEHTRILSHLGFLAYLPFRLGLTAPVPGLRERLREQLARLTGNRVHPMVCRLGGLAADADDAWLRQEGALLDEVRATADALSVQLESAEWGQASRGVAVIDADLVDAYGLSGPVARASGVGLDLRRTAPYLAYAELGHLIGDPPDTAGDAGARMAALVHDVRTSADLVAACTERLLVEPGPVSVRLPKIVKLPEGEVYTATEAPLGLAGVFLVSRGEKTPWRLRLRTPSFSNVACLETLLRGVPVAHLETTLASVGYVVGDIDR